MTSVVENCFLFNNTAYIFFYKDSFKLMFQIKLAKSQSDP